MKNIRVFLLSVVALLLLYSCAKIVEPVGGPRDTTPPKILKEVPANQNVNFTGSQIRVTMDEYFTLNNPLSNVLVSPPLKYPIEYKINEKTLVMKFKDTLQENTTYNMTFSNCIQDYHENNKLNYYHYSFSTGNHIDSFMLKGCVKNAESLVGAEDFTVMLYKEDVDSLPLTTLPNYISKTLKDGTFSFQNVAPGSYKVFALKDINSNFIYDLPNEEIAFAGSPVDACPPLVKDSSDTVAEVVASVSSLELFSFIATDTNVKMAHYDNPELGLYRFPFSSTVSSLDIQSLYSDAGRYEQWSENRDTLTWYLKEPVFDSLSYVFSHNGINDTVRLKPYKPKQSPKGRSGVKSKEERLKVTFKDEGHFYKPVRLCFSYPIRPVDSFDVFLICQIQGKKDTAHVRVSVPDTFVTELPIHLKMESRRNYTLVIPDSTFYGYNGLTNDTLRANFTAQSEKDYGNIAMKYDLSQVSCPMIVQLLKDKIVLQEDRLRSTSTISYQHLLPGLYQIRIIYDVNDNGRWDRGDYRLGRQPERIVLYGKNITVRAYWDVEDEFKIDRNK